MKKPPLGIIPKEFHDKKVKSARFVDLRRAIAEYYDANLPIDVKWVEEYNELLKEEI